jgi:hypothetical protein
VLSPDRRSSRRIDEVSSRSTISSRRNAIIVIEGGNVFERAEVFLRRHFPGTC